MTTVELLAGLAEQSFHDSSVLYSQVAALEEQDSILSDMNLASTARQTEQSDEDEIEMRYIYIYIRRIESNFISGGKISKYSKVKGSVAPQPQKPKGNSFS